VTEPRPTDPPLAGASATPPGPGADASAAAAPPPPDAAELPPPSAAEAPPAGLWDRMRKDPHYAPEHLALEAVRRLGPEAVRWADRTRAMRPGIAPDELADLAVRKFVTYSRLSGAVSGAAGLPGAVVDVGVLAWTQARMVLHIAAAYGRDPVHADRATDLLVLQKVHKAAEAARLALGVAAGRERSGALLGRSDAPVARVMLRLAGKLAQMAGIRAVNRVAAKAIPGAAIVLGTWANSSATRGLAARAREFYRHDGNPGARQVHPS
jgi:hypothetical protein